MPNSEGEPPRSPGSGGQVAAPIELDAIAEAIEYGPRGAILVAGIATALLFVGWLAFYFLLFIPRGSIG
jgi:hypothetical protein